MCVCVFNVGGVELSARRWYTRVCAGTGSMRAQLQPELPSDHCTHRYKQNLSGSDGVPVGYDVPVQNNRTSDTNHDLVAPEPGYGAPNSSSFQIKDGALVRNTNGSVYDGFDI